MSICDDGKVTSCTFALLYVLLIVWCWPDVQLVEDIGRRNSGPFFFNPGLVFHGLRCARRPCFARGSSQRCISSILGNPNTAPLRHWASPNTSVPYQLASLAIGIFGKSFENCWDPIGMKLPERNAETLSSNSGSKAFIKIYK
jgi:hypothetical protein